MTTDPRPVLLYDGHCALCNSWVRILLALDGRGELCFAALQSEIAKKLLRGSGIDVHQPQSVVLVEGVEDATIAGEALRRDATAGHPSHIHTRSDAVLAAIEHLGSPWKYLSFGRYFPRFLRDRIYDFIAANRYAWFGRYDSCPAPELQYRDRFLDLH